MATIVQTHYLGYWRPYHRRLNCLYQEACAHGNITLQLFMWLPLYSLEEPISEVSSDIVDRRSRNANACCRRSMHALGHCVAITHLTWRFGIPCTAVMSPKRKARQPLVGSVAAASVLLGSVQQVAASVSAIEKKHIWALLQTTVRLAEATIVPRKARHLSVLCLQNINSNIVTRIDNCIQYHIQLSLHL